MLTTSNPRTSADHDVAALQQRVAQLEAQLVTQELMLRGADDREHLYTHALDAVSDMVLVKGAKSRIFYANKAFRDFYGMTQDETIPNRGQRIWKPSGFG